MTRRLERLEVLYKISNILNTTLEPKKVLKAVLKEVVRITQASSGSIAMLDAQGRVLHIEAAININPGTWKKLKLGIGRGITGHVAATGKPLRVDDVRKNRYYVSLKPEVRSELAVPLFLNRQVIGVINVDSDALAAFGEDDEKMLIAVAEQASRVIEMAQLYSELKSHGKQMESLLQLGQQLTLAGSVDSIRDLLVREGRRLLHADACALFDVTEDGSGLRLVQQSPADHPAEKGGDIAAQRFPERLHAADQPIGAILRRRTSLLHPEARGRQTGFNGQEPTAYTSFLAVPVTFQGEMQAVLAAMASSDHAFSRMDLSIGQLLANQFAIALENARRQERLLAMEESLNRAERFSLLGTLAAEIAHEIRNPVTIINLLLDGIRIETQGNAQVANDLRIVTEKLDRINRIIDQTLNIARNREPEFEPVCPNTLVTDLLSFLHYKFAKGGIEVRTQLEEDIAQMQADRVQIQQVLLNLIMNAVQSMKAGGRLTVKTRMKEDALASPCIAISVSDTGVGIRREDLGSLFDPFYTTRPDGTGLGLFISQKLVAAHNGELKVRSEFGKGSTFTVLLPLEPATPAHEAPRP